MASQQPSAAPERGEMHDALAVFVGEWHAQGWSFGAPTQHAGDPRATRVPWTSRHTARWHTGEFFVIQDEKAMSGPDGPAPFDTISVMGVDPDSGRYFARTFENHGFQRCYDMARDGDLWTLTGPTERARIAFSADGATQTHRWEWLKDGAWIPLCDRTATRDR